MAETEAQMIDRVFLRPHNSKINGQMVVSLRKWYGIEPLWTLTILGAESSMAHRKPDGSTDPEQGGRLVTEANNFGGMQWNGYASKWGRLACGSIEVAGRTWYVFPDAWKGITAWGRLMKLGPPSKPGFYLDRLKAQDWFSFCQLYYGRNVSGFDAYLANIIKIAGAVRSKAQAAGFAW